MFMPGPFEITIICVVAILLFGNRLPSVMRSIGSSFVEFKKGLRGIEDEVSGVADEISSVARETKEATNAK
jgi:sec-independent protein translocase protein TatA